MNALAKAAFDGDGDRKSRDLHSGYWTKPTSPPHHPTIGHHGSIPQPIPPEIPPPSFYDETRKLCNYAIFTTFATSAIDRMHSKLPPFVSLLNSYHNSLTWRFGGECINHQVLFARRCRNGFVCRGTFFLAFVDFSCGLPRIQMNVW